LVSIVHPGLRCGLEDITIDVEFPITRLRAGATIGDDTKTVFRTLKAFLTGGGEQWRRGDGEKRRELKMPHITMGDG